MSPIKVLLADDEKVLVDLMAKRIVSEGFGVVKAYDGQEAWDKIVAESPDVILLDLTMPYKDGYQILKELRENPPSDKWQPVIIVSAHNELADIKKGLNLEADHYITKPCSMDDILKALRLMINLIPHHKSGKELSSENPSQGGLTKKE